MPVIKEEEIERGDIRMQDKGYRMQDKGFYHASSIMHQSSLFVIVFSLAFIFPSLIYAKVFTVGAEYKTIAEALKKAKDGDTVEVKSGEYRERIKIDKAVTLKGIDRPSIVGNGGVMIEVTGKGATIEGFMIRDENTATEIGSAGVYVSKGADNVTVRNNAFHGVMHGVWTVGTNGIKVENNTVVGKKNLDRNYRGNGVYLTGCLDARIIGNKMEHCRDGMYLENTHDSKVVGNEIRDSRYAIHTMWVDRAEFTDNRAFNNLVGFAIMYSKQSTISGNVAVANQTHGLLLIQTVRSRITGNTVIGNTKGVFLYNSILNDVSSNLVMNNNLGLHNWGGSEENSIAKNSFIKNEVQVKFIAGRNQQWDGNYWSDYIGWDMTGDGTGDMPYESNTVVDHILWRYPSAKLLYASPSFQMLWMLEKQFPILKAPRVFDGKPSMMPLHKEWKDLMAKYPQRPEKYYGDIEKFQVAH